MLQNSVSYHEHYERWFSTPINQTQRWPNLNSASATRYDKQIPISVQGWSAEKIIAVCSRCGFGVVLTSLRFSLAALSGAPMPLHRRDSGYPLPFETTNRSFHELNCIALCSTLRCTRSKFWIEWKLPLRVVVVNVPWMYLRRNRLVVKPSWSSASSDGRSRILLSISLDSGIWLLLSLPLNSACERLLKTYPRHIA